MCQTSTMAAPARLPRMVRSARKSLGVPRFRTIASRCNFARVRAVAEIVASARAFTARQPLRTIGLLIGGWIALAVLNSEVAIGYLHLRSPPLFPLWTFERNGPYLAGLPWSVVFLALVTWARHRVGRFGAVQSLLLGFALILLGNLSHGGLDAGIRRPLYASGVQYWDDAMKIVDGAAWLRSFNDHQTQLFLHPRTHPPFAVLMHYLFRKVFGDNLTAVGLTLAFISSLTVPVIWKCWPCCRFLPSDAAYSCFCFL